MKHLVFGDEPRCGALFPALAALLLSLPSPASAQTTAAEAPIITTEAVGEVSLPPDHARLTFGVTALAPTAAGASAEMARVMAQVRDSLVAAGVPRDSVPTMGYSIRQRRSIQSDTLIGYQGQTSVVVSIRDFARIGAVIEAILGAGANDIRTVEFRADDRRAARDEAIGAAVEAARGDAMALARAGSSNLGELLELSTVPYQSGRSTTRIAGRNSRQQETIAIQVVPRDIIVRVHVTARWRLETNGNE